MDEKDFKKHYHENKEDPQASREENLNHIQKIKNQNYIRLLNSNRRDNGKILQTAERKLCPK